jgi:hypothetical protein
MLDERETYQKIFPRGVLERLWTACRANVSLKDCLSPVSRKQLTTLTLGF